MIKNKLLLLYFYECTNRLTSYAALIKIYATLSLNPPDEF